MCLAAKDEEHLLVEESISGNAVGYFAVGVRYIYKSIHIYVFMCSKGFFSA